MHSLAEQLNKTIYRENPNIFAMLSKLGKEIYFPKVGILNQSAEAKKKASKFNATIGIALENGEPMHLDVFQQNLSAYSPKDLYPYAPPAGKPELRSLWREKLLEESPSLKEKTFSLPVVTNALTHGLSIAADLFADEGDSVILPDKNWENYELTFGVRRGAEITSYTFFNENGGFNAEGLRQTILNQKEKGKAIVLLNFPNNPTGYTPNKEEAAQITAAIEEGAKEGIKLVVITDDAYYGLFFENSLKESLFSELSNIHPNVLALKVDGSTKEDYVWGFRVGFLTFGAESEELLQALEQKTLGIIRAATSSGSHPSQTFVLEAMKSPEYKKQKEEKFEVMKRRANKVKALLDSGKFESAWEYYPFNSGYFMCLKLKTANAEKVRTLLLEEYGIGTIALGQSDLRVAFSCIEEEDLEELYTLIYEAAKKVEEQQKEALEK
ncbi:MULTISPECIES: aminotransferase class I/II-fold pyridoxal phosphate-dependent enzyme [Bacillus]|uniref:Aminotransferase class I/classII large domain-containing protein n=2 Tax=Bacillus TaxID=1386 RepID=A0A0M5JB31_9BACI|nr:MULTISPECIES: aminotransferase class I/II-fold pyridoxal phosphate-dependent enzyme [Bacillus]ALC80669.1 hypothetical protein AM592_03015 [Bacillus gobiensis]MBP1079559.1 aspartate/methionine/tyrosine aminotransferase [Bacillus capparidis]MED1094960.1 aminotransferase class I/II-fold pyridoxal phosphate-dependent enzyme [Bacillus capparidis]